MITVYSINPISERHLHKVMKDMVSAGQGPMLQAVDFGGFVVPLEGCHRIEAARRLGYPVCFLPIDRSQTIDESDIDGLFLGGRKWKAKELGLRLVKNRFKMFTPIYKWDPETGIVELEYYPECSFKQAAKITGVVSVVALVMSWTFLFFNCT